jgi:hypothetical protein
LANLGGAPVVIRSFEFEDLIAKFTPVVNESAFNRDTRSFHRAIIWSCRGPCQTEGWRDISSKLHGL